MRKLIQTAVLAVFFSLIQSGCYTQFGKPTPETGERTRYLDYDYDDYYYHRGYSSPWFYGYPYYSYGYFYSPWWYDQIYYYYYADDGYRSGYKSVRSRDHGYSPSPLPPSNGGIAAPPSNPPPSGEVRIKSGSDSRGNSGNGGSRKIDSGGKSTRDRR